jgi:hypothetical protein
MKLRLHPSLLDRLGVTPNADGSLTGAQVLDALTKALVVKQPAAAIAPVAPADDQLYDELFPKSRRTAAETAAQYTADENDAYYALFPEERP